MRVFYSKSFVERMPIAENGKAILKREGGRSEAVLQIVTGEGLRLFYTNTQSRETCLSVLASSGNG
jgi:hypothetical protein